MGNRRDRSARRGGEGAGLRGLRLQQLFREELNSILDGELADRRFDGVRVTFVELSRDGSRARIWYCMNSNTDSDGVSQLERAFAHASGFFRARLCEALPLKRMPELTYRRDPAALPVPTDPAAPEAPTAEGKGT